MFGATHQVGCGEIPNEFSQQPDSFVGKNGLDLFVVLVSGKSAGRV